MRVRCRPNPEGRTDTEKLFKNLACLTTLEPFFSYRGFKLLGMASNVYGDVIDWDKVERQALWASARLVDEYVLEIDIHAMTYFMRVQFRYDDATDMINQRVVEFIRKIPYCIDVEVGRVGEEEKTRR